MYTYYITTHTPHSTHMYACVWMYVIRNSVALYVVAHPVHILFHRLFHIYMIFIKKVIDILFSAEVRIGKHFFTIFMATSVTVM